MRSVLTQFVSLALAGLSYYALSIPTTPVGQYIKIGVAGIVYFVAYLLFRKKKDQS